MLGHLKPILCGLSETGKSQYWQYYCSVCASLRSENNLAYSFLLNNELTLVLAAFQNEIEQEAKSIRTVCPAKAYLGKNDALTHQSIEMAGKLSVILGWIKILDWQTDKPRFYKKIILHKVQKKVDKILPTLTENSLKIINDYVLMTKNDENDFEIIKKQSNDLSQTLVQEIAQLTNATPEYIQDVKTLFGKAGEIIAVADHLIDVEADRYGKQYNPILFLAEQNKTPLAEEYIKLRIKYNRLQYAIREILPKTNRYFGEMMYKSLANLNQQVKKFTPAFMKEPETIEIAIRMNVAASDFMAVGATAQVAADCCDGACGEVCINICATVACQVCWQSCWSCLCQNNRNGGGCCDSNRNNNNNNSSSNSRNNNNSNNNNSNNNSGNNNNNSNDPYYDPNNPNNNNNNNNNNNSGNNNNPYYDPNNPNANSNTNNSNTNTNPTPPRKRRGCCG